MFQQKRLFLLLQVSEALVQDVLVKPGASVETEASVHAEALVVTEASVHAEAPAVTSFWLKRHFLGTEHISSTTISVKIAHPVDFHSFTSANRATSCCFSVVHRCC